MTFASSGRGDRKRLYILEQTVTDRYFYDPEQIRQDFGEALDAWEGSFEDFVIEMFQQHDGSLFVQHWFSDDANPSVGTMNSRGAGDGL